MAAAVNAVRKKDMELKKAAIPFSFPRSTLKDYVKKGEHDVEKRVLGNLGRKPVLPPELQNEFVKFCLNMEKKFFGLFHSNISERRVRQGTAVIVTGSPHKQKVIEERGRKKARGNTELGAEAKKKRTQQRKMRLQQRRNLLQEGVQNVTETPRKEERCFTSFFSSSKDDNAISLVETDDEDRHDDAQCDKFFSNDKHGETWVQFSKCRKWYHSICGRDNTTSDRYICDVCLEG
jgi:hypothetical protein